MYFSDQVFSRVTKLIKESEGNPFRENPLWPYIVGGVVSLLFITILMVVLFKKGWYKKLSCVPDYTDSEGEENERKYTELMARQPVPQILVEQASVIEEPTTP